MLYSLSLKFRYNKVFAVVNLWLYNTLHDQKYDCFMSQHAEQTTLALEYINGCYSDSGQLPRTNYLQLPQTTLLHHNTLTMALMCPFTCTIEHTEHTQSKDLIDLLLKPLYSSIPIALFI